jgi:glycosyltransferase involved in cell wall biosynthesis
VIDKKTNEDASFARKTALERSTGKYILPIDSDDYVKLTMIENLYYCAKVGEYDILCCEYFEEKNGKTRVVAPQVVPEDKIGRMKYGTFGFGNVKVLWNKLVKREIYEKIVFKKTGTNEDCFITAQLFYYADKIGYIPLPLYHWQFNENSVTNNKLLAQKRYEDRKVNYEHIIEFCKEKFGDDLSIFEPELSVRMQRLERE